jgi:hypothetical protein
MRQWCPSPKIQQNLVTRCTTPTVPAEDAKTRPVTARSLKKNPLKLWINTRWKIMFNAQAGLISTRGLLSCANPSSNTWSGRDNTFHTCPPAIDRRLFVVLESITQLRLRKPRSVQVLHDILPRPCGIWQQLLTLIIQNHQQCSKCTCVIHHCV